jgi:uncharacterized protein (TIGR03067 family)
MKKIQNQNFAICQNPNGIPSQSPRLSPGQNPKGIPPSSPGLRGTSYPGLRAFRYPPTLKGLRPCGPALLQLLAAAIACSLILLVQTATAATEEGFTSIFNGKDLTGWDGNPALWSVKGGAIVGQTSEQNPIKNNTFLIWTNGTVGDFELRCSFKIEPVKIVQTNPNTGVITTNNFANSGIQYRSKVLDPKGWVVGGYQADMEAGKTYTGILYEERMTRGIMAARGEKVVWDKDCKKQVTGSLGSSDEIQAAIKQGDWNEYVIIAQGNHLQHFINGKQTVDVTDDCESKRAMNGVLALQLHAGPPMKVQFRDLRLRTGSVGKEAAADPLAPFQGTWEIVSFEKDGSTAPQDDIAGITVMITGSAYKLINKDNVSKGTFTVDASKDPKEMDVHHQSESGNDQTMPAIYEITADSFRVCYNPEGGTRPTSFSTKPDSGFLSVSYKRKAE